MKNGIYVRNVPGMTEKLSACRVGIAGCGGLGSNAAVALARAGVGNLVVADFDVVEESNLNRQYFLKRDVGRKKVEALKDIIHEINSDISVKTIDRKLVSFDVSTLFKDCDILIEAFDVAESKKWLIDSWCREHPDRPVVSGNGLAGYGRTDEISVTKAGNIYFCGDLKSDMKTGLCSARVAMVANMQANVAIELLMEGTLGSGK